MPKRNSKSSKRKTMEKLSDPIVTEEDVSEVDKFLKACQDILGNSDGDTLSDQTSVSDVPDDVREIQFKQGFCVKTIDEKGEKVFLNICHCDEVEVPPEITEEELQELLTSDEESAYRIPMSLGVGHEETDKSGKKCLVYDIVVNSNFFDKTQKSEFFKMFLVNIACEGIEMKFSCKLSRENVIVLKNKHYHGKTQKHYIRSKPKALITEVTQSDKLKLTSKLETDSNISKTKIDSIDEGALLTSSKTTYLKKEPSLFDGVQAKESTGLKKPELILRREPPRSTVQPTKIVAQLLLTGHVDSKDLQVDVGEDRIVVEDTRGLYDKTDVYLPFNIDQDQCKAEFNKTNSILTLTLICSS